VEFDKGTKQFLCHNRPRGRPWRLVEPELDRDYGAAGLVDEDRMEAQESRRARNQSERIILVHPFFMHLFNAFR
jgi:hypothetical protein